MSDLLRILVAPVAWLAAFCAVYGLQGWICAGGNESDAGPRLAFGLAFLLAILLQVALLILLYSARFGARPGFTRTVSRTGGWVGLVATTWTLFPTLTASVCA